MSIRPRSEQLSQSSQLAEAFALRRAWIPMTPPCQSSFSKSDALVLALFLQQLDCLNIVIHDEILLRSLSKSFKSVRSFESILVDCNSTEPESVLHLIDLSKPVSLVNMTEANTYIGYGLRNGINIGILSALRPWLLPISCCGSALWNCGLVWLEAKAPPTMPTPIKALVDVFKNEAFDPLRLYEDAQKSVSNPQGTSIVEPDLIALKDEVKALKSYVSQLEQLGLVRHELQIAKAADRQRRSA